jgi:hypothetical protein
MKLLLLLVSLSVMFLNCNKLKEQVQENIVIRAMTEGQWRITKFTKAGADKTTDYAPYLFQFHANNKVDAINNGTTEKTGTWQADPNAKTISSSFLNASVLLTQLNGTWQITRNSWTYVEATQTVNGEKLTLRLDK